MTEIEDRIRELGQKREFSELGKFINDTDEEQLKTLIALKIKNSNFSYTFNYILQGFAESDQAQKKRCDIVLEALKELDKHDHSMSHINTIIDRICVDLRKYKSQYLLQLSDFCFECIQNYVHGKNSWKGLFPIVVSVISEKEKVEYNDKEITGVEFKNQLVNSLCMLQWPADIVVPITSAFIDMPLTKDEHTLVVNKLGQYIDKLTPQEVPPFVFQLLKLCKNQNCRSVFMRLQNYFGLRVYENENSESNSENTDILMDAIECTTYQEAVEAESTVLYHIHSSASLSHNFMKDYLSSLKNTLRSPEFVLHPFQLSVLLTISTINLYEEKVFDIIRLCISRSFNEDQKKTISFWLSDMVPATTKVETVFQQVVNLSLQDRELVLQGLVNFAFTLLNVGPRLFVDAVIEKQWQLGSMILIKIIKKKRHKAAVILQTLANFILIGQNTSQHIECLYILTRSLPILMLENQNCIVQLMEGLIKLPGASSVQLLDAIMPLTKVSSTIRDQFILLLRKALYSGILDTRLTAVIAFVKLLTSLKISDMAVLSQNSESTGSFRSGHSLFTQISLNRTSQFSKNTFSNEALCLEALSILGRCFTQQVEIRNQLYEGFYEVVCKNSEMSIAILNALWSHFSNYYVRDRDVLPPLLMNKIFVTKDVDVILQEPLGKLIYIIGLVAIKANEINDDNATTKKVLDTLDLLCERMKNCELVHFELDDGTDLLDIVPESQQKLLILKEILCVYEGLMGYKVLSWKSKTENNAPQILSLFHGYSRFIQFSKNVHKPKKDNKKKKNDSTSRSQSLVDLTVGEGNQKSSKTFKTPETVFDFQGVIKLLSLLNEPTVDWAKIPDANTVKSNKEIHCHALQATFQLLQNLKHKKIIDVHINQMYYNNLVEVGVVLYNRCIKKFNDYSDFDVSSALLAADCFYLILQVICGQYKSNFSSFLAKLVKRQEDLVTCLTDVLQVYQHLFERDEAENAEDADTKKCLLIIIQTFSLLCTQIPKESSALSVKLYDWIKNIAKNDTLPNKQIITYFINLFFSTHIKFKISLKLFEDISAVLGDVIGTIAEEDHGAEEFKIINESSANTIYLCFTNTLKNVLEEIDWIISRLKSEFCMISYPGTDNIERKREYLKSKERGVTCQLCYVVTILINLCNIGSQPGNMTESLLKNLIQLYLSISNLTKHFLVRSSKLNPVFQGARFERLVKLTGKGLSPAVYRLITFMEESQKHQTQETQSKRKTSDNTALKNKILKETRLIPKVVYEIEQFSKCVIQLSKKANVDLATYVGQGTVRDFRIIQLKQVLEKAGNIPCVSSQSQNYDDRTNNESTNVESENNDSDGEDGSPQPKRTKQ